MRAISFYHKETGLLTGNQLIVSDNDMLAANTPANHIAIDGHYDNLSQKVDIANPTFLETTGMDGEAVQTPVYSVIDYQPPQPSTDHEWNDETKRWQLSAAAAGKINRSNAARIRISQLEVSQHRHVREHCLGIAGAAERLKAIDDEIFSLRSQLQ